MAPSPTSPDTAHGVLEALQALPIGMHVTIGVGLIAGLMLWLFGRRVIRPVFVVVGMAAGAGIGLLLTPTLGLPAIGPLAPPYVGLAAGSVVGLIAAAILFRMTMAVAAAAVLAIAGVLSAGIYLD
jgi:hypothetical protein